MDKNALIEIPHYTGITQSPLLTRVGHISMPSQGQKDHSNMNNNIFFFVWYGTVQCGIFFMVYGKGCFSLLRQMLFKR